MSSPARNRAKGPWRYLVAAGLAVVESEWWSVHSVSAGPAPVR